MKPSLHRHCRTGLRLGLGLSLMAGAVQAQIPPRQYQADFETADWQVESGGRTCALSHEVPGFGTVRFVQNWAEPMRFQVRVPMAVSAYDSVSIRSTPAPWQHRGEIRELGRVRVGDTMQPVDLHGETVRDLLAELQEGRFTRLGWKKHAAVVEEMQVTVPSVRLRSALPEFQRCLAGVMQLDFMPVGEYRIDFENDSTRLGYLARRALEPAIQRYKGSQSGIGRIVVAGYADSSDSTTANERASLARARAVRDYLVERGIPRQRIEVRGYGERWELEPDNPESNRRAAVWLVER